MEKKVSLMIEQSFNPTCKRVLELQNRLGEMAKIYNECQQNIKDVKSEMQEALGIGQNQTLKN